MEKNQEILETVNEFLNTEFAHIDDVPVAELQRVCIMLQLAVHLKEHPETQIFMCRPDEGIIGT